MATTYLKAHHISRGETIVQSMRDRFDYGQNPDKTEQGELIMAYECDPRTADAEFLLTKARYKVITGREQKRDADVLCYQTGPIPIVISISIRPLWTAPENTGISSARPAPCASSLTEYVLSTAFPSFRIRS